MLFGSPAFRERRQAAQTQGLMDFSTALNQTYGHAIAKAARRVIAVTSNYVTLQSARTAIATAQHLLEAAQTHRRSNVSAFSALLAQESAVPRAHNFERADAPRASKRDVGATLAQWPCVPELLARVTLGSALTQEVSQGRLRNAVHQACGLMDILGQAPGMTAHRAQEILTLAAMVNDPRAAQALVRELACGAPQRQSMDRRGVAKGAAIGEHIPQDFRARHEISFGQDTKAAHSGPGIGWQRGLDHTVQDAPMVDVVSPEGSPFRLHQTMLKDCDRSTFVVDGVELKKDARTFAAAFRSQLPPGRRGDALAELASVCLNQNNLNTVSNYATNHALLPLGDGSEESSALLHEVIQLNETNWLLRSSSRKAFQTFLKPDGVRIELPVRSMALYTVECLLTCGEGASAKPSVTEMHVDVAFASQSILQPPQAAS